MVLVVPSAETTSAARVTGFSSSRKRITNRGKNRIATTITFGLSEPARLVFVFRGPGPSCDVAARMAVLGLAGLNRVRFDGTIRKRRLESGTYLLVTRLKNEAEPLSRTYLTIVDPRAPFAPRVLPQCTRPAASWLTFAHPLLTPLGGTFTGQAAPTANGTPQTDEGPGNVLKKQTQAGSALPELPQIESTVPGALAILLLALFFGSVLVFLVALAINLRSPREPRV